MWKNQSESEDALKRVIAPTNCEWRQGSECWLVMSRMQRGSSPPALPASSLGRASKPRGRVDIQVGELLEAIADPSHERHGELKEWLADDFNPHVVDIDWLSKDVADLAQRWSRQPAVKRRRTA